MKDKPIRPQGKREGSYLHGRGKGGGGEGGAF